MKEQIEQAISEGRTEDALNLLAASSNDAVLLQARFNQGKKQYNMGLIEYSEWARVQAQINYAALEMAGKVKNTNGAAKPVSDNASAGSTQPSVFISYNHKDAFAMRSLKGSLENAGIKVFVDIFEMQVGEEIQAFIDKALKDNMFILSLVSENSLVSGWVNVELTSAILLNKFGKKWIPARLDNTCFDADFFFNTLQAFDERIDKSRANIQKALDRKVDIRPFQDELGRLEDLKSNFGKIIQKLKEVLVVDVSETMFDLGITKIIAAIK